MTPAIADSRYYGLSLLRTLAITDSKLRPEGVRYNES